MNGDDRLIGAASGMHASITEARRFPSPRLEKILRCCNYRRNHWLSLPASVIRGALLGRGHPVIQRTRYFDFGQQPAWRGLRRFE